MNSNSKQNPIIMILLVVILALVAYLVINSTTKTTPVGENQSAAAGKPKTNSNTKHTTHNNFVVDTIAPVITSFTTPSTSHSLSIPYSIVATDDSGIVTGYIVTMGTRPTASDLGWTTSASGTYVLPASVDGKMMTLNAYAKDAAGNISNAFSSPTIYVTLSGGTPDTIPPTVNITSPMDGDVVSGIVPFTVSVTDNIAVKSVYFYADNGAINVGRCDAGQACNSLSEYKAYLDTTKLTPGMHWLTVQAYDTTGNENEQWIQVTI